MAKYILLSPLTPEHFGLDNPLEILEALNEFGCGMLFSSFPDGRSVYYATSNNQDALTRMCETVQLPGIVLEYTAIYDQKEI